MNEGPSRTVEVTLDTKSAALLMARGQTFRLEGVKERFREHLRPPLIVELLAAHPGAKLLKSAARVVAGVIRLVLR